jgi:hypothetical protein
MDFLLGIPTTFMTIATVIAHWATFDWLNRFLAIELVIVLAVSLGFVLNQGKAWARRLELTGFSDLRMGYMWLILATILYNRH